MLEILATIHTFDVALSTYVANMLRSTWLTEVFYFITKVGDWEVLSVIIGVTALYLCYRRWFVEALWLVVVTAGAGLTTHYLKLVFMRERPEFRLLEETSLSFPSGHATGAAAVGGALGWLAYRHATTKRRRQLVIIAAVLFIVLISFSRVYLGVHYLTDILAGWMVAGTWIFGGLAMTHRLNAALTHKRSLKK